MSSDAPEMFWWIRGDGGGIEKFKIRFIVQGFLQRAGLDYKVDQDKLPEGSIEIDWVRIEFPPKEAIGAARL